MGTSRSSSASQIVPNASLGISQSPRGESDPPDETLGPFGIAERLNWLAKKRLMNTSSQRRIVGRSYATRSASGKPAGQVPAATSDQACWARKAIFPGPIP